MIMFTGHNTIYQTLRTNLKKREQAVSLSEVTNIL